MKQKTRRILALKDSAPPHGNPPAQPSGKATSQYHVLSNGSVLQPGVIGFKKAFLEPGGVAHTRVLSSWEVGGRGSRPATATWHAQGQAGVYVKKQTNKSNQTKPNSNTTPSKRHLRQGQLLGTEHLRYQSVFLDNRSESYH